MPATPETEARTALELPPDRVTVLEDRAQVERRGRAALAAGTNKLVIHGVSPLLQDVSLQTECPGVTVAAARVVRRRRVLAADRPAAVAEVEAELDELDRRMQVLRDQIERAQQRHQRLVGMVVSAAKELPEDASWGRGDADAWHHAFERLFARSRTEDESALSAHHEHQQLLDEWQAVNLRRQQLAHPATDVEAMVELDLVTEEAGEHEISVVYVVPAAMWRPLHRAELVDGERPGLRWTPRACVWQRTGEDWPNVTLRLSTARTDSGTEPPLLRDDALQVQRKADEVKVEVRDVDIATTGPTGPSGPRPLPGVDDGGEARHLEVPGRVRVATTGRPVFFDLAQQDIEAEVSVVTFPEIRPRAIRRVAFTLPGDGPLLPGPVELLRHGGPFARADIDFTAPGAFQELSFGPDDDTRVQRDQRLLSDEVDRTDEWRRQTQQIRVFLSNVGPAPRTVEVVERVPISEVEVVRIEGVQAEPAATPDEHGHVRWSVTVPPNGRATLQLQYTLATAPGVQS